jgi:hypothetical protein
MKVGVVGNCQAILMASCLRQLLPDAEIVEHETWEPDYDAAANALAACDYVISQHLWDEFGPLDNAKLVDRVPHFLVVPSISFTGFHPDTCYLLQDKHVMPSPIGAYHSKIIAIGFSIGLSESRVEQLFNSYIYSVLGYFTEFRNAEMNLDASMRSCGIDLSTKTLMADGSFMHTINHPRFASVLTLIRCALDKLELVPATTSVIADTYLDRDTQWPIYPEVGRRIGMAGDYTYVKPLNPEGDKPREISLREFIVESYKMYRDFPNTVFEQLSDNRARLLEALVSNYPAASGFDGADAIDAHA